MAVIQKDNLITMTLEDYNLIQKHIKILEGWIDEKEQIIEAKDKRIDELRGIISQINIISKI